MDRRVFTGREAQAWLGGHPETF
jgi:hypothetical protein